MASKPVAIPSSRQPSCQHGQPINDNGIYFGMIDNFDSGEAIWLLSDGSGKFAQLLPGSSVPQLIFIVENRRRAQVLVIEVLSTNLKDTVRGILGRVESASSKLEMNLKELIDHYHPLKKQLAVLKRHNPHSINTIHLELLLHGCLLNQSLYHDLDNDFLPGYLTGPQKTTFVQDVLSNQLLLGLEELDECFCLGTLTEEATAHILATFNHQFEQLAFAGDLQALRALVEPVVESGKAEFQQDAAFLAKVLAGGHRKTYEYLVDVSQRTTMNIAQGTGLGSRGRTSDPLYQAIRQGHLEEVKACMTKQMHTFESSYTDHRGASPADDTPLQTAVRWNRCDVVRLFLDFGHPFLDGWECAMTLAKLHHFKDILDLMERHERRHAVPAQTLGRAMSPYVESGIRQAGFDALASHQGLVMNREVSRSVSEIANEFYGLEPESRTPNNDRYSVFSSIAFPPTPSTSSWTTDMKSSETQTTSYAAYHLVQCSAAHVYRLKIGQDLATRLESRCERLRSMTTANSWSNTASLMCNPTVQSVWEEGLRCIRQLLRNHTLLNASEVMCVLLVADAASPDHASVNGPPNSADHARWRAMLSIHEQPLLDQLIQLAFGSAVPAAQTPPTTTEELCRLGEIAQSLISVEPTDGPGDDRPAMSGQRLPFVYGCHHRWESSNEYSEYRQPGFTWFDHTAPTSAVLRNAFCAPQPDLADFVGTDRLQQGAGKTKSWNSPHPPASGADWKNIDPTVVLLLGSSQLTGIVHAITRVQLPKFARSQTPHDWEAFQSRGQWTALQRLEEFCHITEASPQRPSRQGVTRASSDVDQPSMIPMMKSCIQCNDTLMNKLSRSLDPYHLKVGSGSTGLCAEDLTNASFLSSSVPLARPNRLSDRLRCLSMECPKTFSNISNRNKHMREGCAFREGRKYKCRNEGCGKLLTTKWYRSTHESTRCRYRSVVTRQGSPASEDYVMGGELGTPRKHFAIL